MIWGRKLVLKNKSNVRGEQPCVYIHRCCEFTSYEITIIILHFSETSCSLLEKRSQEPWLYPHTPYFLPFPSSSTNFLLSPTFSFHAFSGTKSQPTSYSCANKQLENHFAAPINVQWITGNSSRTDGHFIDSVCSVEQSWDTVNCVTRGKVYQENIIKRVRLENSNIVKHRCVKKILNFTFFFFFF